jgi:hypothetical protein
VRRSGFARWAPLGFAVAVVSLLLLRAGTSPADLLRYTAYAALAVVLPGTLVYRALRRNAYSLVEDLAMGAAVGLVLELAGWALFSALDLRFLVWLWPLLVIVPFVLIPALRRHWLVRDYETAAPLAWSWTVAGVVAFFTAYLATVFLDRNPILPLSDQTLQYLDLSYQLSLAGEASHSFPPGLPQVAAEPLYYHWFAYAHMAMTGMVGQIDLTVVSLRLAIPALCALAILLTAVVGWRISGRPPVGAVAAVLFFAVGEFNFTNPVTMPFGTQVTFVIWHGMSMIYSWVLIIAVILPLALVASSRSLRHDGWGLYVVAGLLLFASSGAKGSSLPVIVATLLFASAVLLVVRRRVPWGLVVALGLAVASQLFATVVLYRFQTYGVSVGLFQGLEPYWSSSSGWLAVAGVWTGFALNMLLRCAGIVPLLWHRRLGLRRPLEPAQWLLLGGITAGVATYVVFSQPSSGSQYFLRVGFTFGVILSAWGYVDLVERASLPRPARLTLGGFGLVFAFVLTWVQVDAAAPVEPGDALSPLVPLLSWGGWLLLAALLLAVLWIAASFWVPALRRRGGLVLLTGILLAGAPGLIMDAYKSVKSSNGGAYALISMPKSRVDAARYVRDHSDPDDVVATNAHCLAYYGEVCDPRSFWLAAYSERSVLVEGWGFAPRAAENNFMPFWDPDLLRLNDEAITASTPQNIARLRALGVRWFVIDRQVSQESTALATLATAVYDNGRVAVYHLP